MITLEMADAYFERHMDKNYWSGLPPETREAALSMAENDIAAELGIDGPDPNSAPQRNAVCEQAVFLTRNYAKQTGGKEIASESLDGVGSRSFHFINNENPGLSPRALAFIKQARRRIPRRTIGTTRG